ncbi:hypothetical protein B7494_g8474 [Chlorociboria aeruginascens]|nr:hypothetical protein B7494_g8474 [Chlorociboria aeruginascens]
MANSILLSGGTILTHDSKDHVKAIKADLLIEGNIIAKIEKGIVASPGTQVIDCTDKILSPGFIDTHHHVWQTLLKGRHANQTLLDYMPAGNFTSSLHDPSDIFWGELGGCLECLDVGTTTVVDHAHMNYSPDHSKAGIAATVSSGIRSVFCYSVTPLVSSWSPFALEQDLLADWVIKTLEELASQAPFNNGVVTLGFGFDGLFLPKEIVVNLYNKVKSLGIKVITSHYVRGALMGSHSLCSILHSYSLLDSTVLLSHASNATPEDAVLLKETNSHVSSTPSTELQMGHGMPVAFSSLGITSQCSIGVDCHSNNSASMVSEMRLLLQSSRSLYNETFTEKGLAGKRLNVQVEEVFNLGTILGARSISLEKEIGSLQVGKKADIVIFDTLNPSMICAAEHDPVAAVVLHSGPGDIDAVIVDGVFRKENGKLKNVKIKGKELWDGVKGKNTLEWRDVALELVKRRAILQAKCDKLDMDEAMKGLIAGFYIDESKIVDSI